MTSECREIEGGKKRGGVKKKKRKRGIGTLRCQAKKRGGEGYQLKEISKSNLAHRCD